MNSDALDQLFQELLNAIFTFLQGLFTLISDFFGGLGGNLQ